MSPLSLAHSVASPVMHTLATRAMLCSLNVSMWTARKQDKRATQELADQHGTAANAVRVNKSLLAHGALASIVNTAAAAGDYHRSVTLPWGERNGPRILPAKLFQRHATKLREYREKHEMAVLDFLSAYPVLKADAPFSLGPFYNPADYPHESEIKHRFSFRVSFAPLPDASDFRCDLEADAVAAIKADMESERLDILDSTIQATAARMRETLASMVERLAAYRSPEETGGRAIGAFHQSLVDSVRDLVDLLPGFNLTDDARITELTDRMRAELCSHDAPDLKESSDLRRDTMKAAEDILASVESFFA